MGALAEHLIRRVAACGYRVEVWADGSPHFILDRQDGWIPPNLMAECKAGRAALVEYLTHTETCPLCFAWVHPPDAARLCNPGCRPLEYLTVGGDGETVRTVNPPCHYQRADA